MYKWIDENGQVHFSDKQPTEETKEIKEYGKDGIRNEPEDETSETEAETDFPLKDVTLVNMYSDIRDGVLKIWFAYYNRDTDKRVYWKEGTVRCQCEVYEDVGKRGKKKGQRIDSLKKELERHDQDIYVDIPDKYLNKGKKGIVECLVDTGYIKKKVSWNPSFGGIKKKTPVGKIREGTASQTLK